MADVTITVQQASAAGATTTRTGSLNTTDTYVVRNNGRTLLLFEKTGAGNCTVTVQTPAKQAGLDVAERTFTVVATTGDVVAGPFPPSVYNDAAGDLRFTLSDAVGLTVAAIAV